MNSEVHGIKLRSTWEVQGKYMGSTGEKSSVEVTVS